jgi:hypothetical protein
LANNPKSTIQLPNKISVYDSNDALVFVYGLDTANNSNNDVAQTAIISLTNFGVAFANSLVIPIANDPSHSNSLTITQGSLFISNSFVYFATQNNYVQRVPLSSF